MLASVPLHGRVMLVRPIIDNKSKSWKAPWTHRVWIFSRHWSQALDADPRFKTLSSAPNPYKMLKVGIRAVVYERVR
jgi:hypothetical protein